MNTNMKHYTIKKSHYNPIGTGRKIQLSPIQIYVKKAALTASADTAHLSHLMYRTSFRPVEV